MTNKEAVTILNSIKMFFCRENGTPFSAGYDAIMKAVRILEQIPDEHGYLIDRDKIKYFGEEEFAFKSDIDKIKPVIVAERKNDERH